MADLLDGRAAAARRAAETLLRTCGGRTLQLRVPLPAVANDVGEQLGSGTALFQDLELAPAVFRRARASLAKGKPPQFEVLVSARVVEGLAGGAGTNAQALLSSALGVFDGTRVLRIEAIGISEAGGVAYVYRLLLRGAAAEAM